MKSLIYFYLECLNVFVGREIRSHRDWGCWQSEEVSEREVGVVWEKHECTEPAETLRKPNCVSISDYVHKEGMWKSFYLYWFFWLFWCDEYSQFISICSPAFYDLGRL